MPDQASIRGQSEISQELINLAQFRIVAMAWCYLAWATPQPLLIYPVCETNPAN